MRYIRRFSIVTTLPAVSILVAVSILAAWPALAQTNHSGDITANQTWYVSGNPHVVTGDVRVFAVAGSCTLTIMPGVFVKFDSATVLQIGTETQKGVLMAVGTSDSTIFFGSNKTEPGPGDWQGILFQTQGNGHVDYAAIQEGGHAPLEANLTVSPGAEPTISNCTIEGSGGYGLVCGDGAGPIVSANTFQNNDLYPVQIYGNEVPLIEESNIFAGKGTNAIKVLGDQISSSAIWPQHNIPYVIAGNLEVSRSTVGDTLTLQPGTVLQFEPEVELRIGAPGSPGFLMANGDTTSIIFAAADTAKAPHWSGLYFSSQGSGLMDSCLVTFGGAGGRMANIFCATASDPVIQSCTVERSLAHGLVCADAALPTIAGNTFQHNGGHAISLFANYVPLIGTDNIYDGNGENAIELKGDNITASVTWPHLDIPYALAGDVSVFNPALGDTLALEPGVTLAFDDDVQLQIGRDGYAGTLLAIGLADSTITFTSSADTAAPGDWADIFCDSLGTAKLHHCLVEYGGGSSHGADIYAASGSILELVHCTVQHSSGDGIACWGSDSVRVTGCLITGNQIGLHCYGSEPVVNYNHIAGNAIYGATNDSDELTVEATGNWWGHPTGPQDTSPGPPSYNPAGEGDRITDYVAYDPWWQSDRPTLLTLDLSDPSPVRADTVMFHLTFSRLMDPAVDPLVTFWPANPLEGNTVMADTGWAADSLTWTGSFVVTDTTGDGPHAITVDQAEDVWGWSMLIDTTHSFFIDTQPPEAIATSPSVSSEDSFMVSWSAVDAVPGSGVAWITVSVSEDDSTWTVWVDSTSADSALYPGQDGYTYFFYAQATDSAGNTETTAAAECTTTVDTTAPALPAMLLPADESVLADSMIVFIWTRVVKADGRIAPLRRVRGGNVRAAKGSPVEYHLQCSVDAAFDSLVINQADLSDSTLTAPLDDGTYFWRVSATDEAAHTSGFPATPFSFQIDTQPPSISATSQWPDTTFLGPFPVSTTVEDASGADPVLLWYRTSLDTVPQADTMMTSGTKGEYEGQIPEQAAVDSVFIEYYIEAYDQAVPPNAATDPPGAPDESVYAFTAYGPVSVPGSSSARLPESFALLQNYPNPFNARTVLGYHIPGWAAPEGSVPVRLDIYNVRGQLVRRLVEAEQAPGIYRVSWDGTDLNGQPASSGLYFCRLQAAGRNMTIKAILLR
jgi:parallel beta-helix repeat protein